MSDLIDTVQLQETADTLVTLFEITLPSGTIVYFFDGLVCLAFCLKPLIKY